MTQINMSSIMGKVRSYAHSNEGRNRIRACIDSYRKSGKAVTDGKESVVTEQTMCTIAEAMINILKHAAKEQQLPESVGAHFNSLTYSPPRVVGTQGDLYQVDIQFTDDLSRMSLLIKSGERKGQRTGEGIKNIVSLFDTGYSASSPVFGVWDTHDAESSVKSLENRDGRWLMSNATETFNRIFGETYNVYAFITADPEFYHRN